MNQTPQKASRPFDRDRDGLIPSGGAATVILESLESALKKRCANIGRSNWLWLFIQWRTYFKPNGRWAGKIFAYGLKDAGIQASEIDYINAHATSTPAGDASEAKAINEVFGEHKPYVSSTKSMTGHECWMAGASEIVYSMLNDAK